jgi:hypothetical protein
MNGLDDGLAGGLGRAARLDRLRDVDHGRVVRVDKGLVLALDKVEIEHFLSLALFEQAQEHRQHCARAAVVKDDLPRKLGTFGRLAIVLVVLRKSEMNMLEQDQTLDHQTRLLVRE